jgi:ATP-dependent RNA helicase DHX37/DHR1
MLLVAAQAGVLDYAIVIVSILSEVSPFSNTVSTDDAEEVGDSQQVDHELDEVDKMLVKERQKKDRKPNRWHHVGGDVLGAMLAVGAYTYAGRGAGGSSEALVNRKFCDENGLNYVIMNRIQKMRRHLASVAKNRLGTAEGVAAKTGGFTFKMKPPDKLQESLLIQSIASGLLDHVALLATPGSISGDYPIDLRSAYIGCTSSTKNPLFLDRASTVYTRDYRQLPRWVCYDSIVRKTSKDGIPLYVMKNITPIDPSFLGEISTGSRLLGLGKALSSPPPKYDPGKDAVLCFVTTKYGSHGWEIPPVKRPLYDVLQNQEAKHSSIVLVGESFRWFARFLLEGKVIPELVGLDQLMNDKPAIITQRTPSAKVNMLVGRLSGEGIDSARALRKHWAENDDKFLFKELKKWIKHENQFDAKKIWIDAVRTNIKMWNDEKKPNTPILHPG